DDGDVARVAEEEGDVRHALGVRVAQIDETVPLAVKPESGDTITVPVATESDIARVAVVEGVLHLQISRVGEDVETAATILKSNRVTDPSLGAETVTGGELGRGRRNDTAVTVEVAEAVSEAPDTL